MRKPPAAGGLLFLNLLKALSGARRANCLRQVLFHELAPFGRDAREISRERCSRKDQKKRDKRKADASDTCRDEHLVHGDYIEAENIEGHMLQWLDVQDGGKRKEEEHDGQ